MELAGFVFGMLEVVLPAGEEAGELFGEGAFAAFIGGTLWFAGGLFLGVVAATIASIHGS